MVTVTPSWVARPCSVTLPVTFTEGGSRVGEGEGTEEGDGDGDSDGDRDGDGVSLAVEQAVRAMAVYSISSGRTCCFILVPSLSRRGDSLCF